MSLLTPSELVRLSKWLFCYRVGHKYWISTDEGAMVKIYCTRCGEK